MTPTVTPQLDLLESLGYEELPEKVWVWTWSVPAAGSYGVGDLAFISSSAKGITLAVRPYFGVATVPRNYLVEDGFPYEIELEEYIASFIHKKGFILYDDNGKEILRRYV